MRKSAFVAACLGMLIFGIVLTTLGAILPSIIERFGIDKAEAGSLFLLMSFGILLGSVTFGPIVDRYSYKGLLIASAALIFVSLEAIAFSPSFDWLRIAVLFVGFGGGVINGGTNALVADISSEGKSANLSLLGIFFGLGAFGVPFSLGFLLNHFTYSSLMAIVGGLVLIPLTFFVFVTFPPPKQAQGFPLKEGLGLTKETTLLLMGFLLFLQSGMEITVGGWSAAFFNEVMNLEANDAVLVLSLFWAGTVLARIILGAVLKRVSPAPVLQVFIGIALVGALLLLLSNSLYLAIPGLFLVGFGLAAGYPVVLGYVGELYARLSGTAFSIVFVIALIGGSLMPYLAGVLGEMLGLQWSLIMVPISLVLMFLLFLVVLRQMARLKLRATAHR